MILLKDGWNTYAEDYDGKTATACVRGAFNDPHPPTLSVLKLRDGKRAAGARMIKENIKKEIGFILLKDGWKYNLNDGEDGELSIMHKDMFNVPQPPIFNLYSKRGGSRVIPENIKKELIGFPSEIIYGLFSTIIGLRAPIKHTLQHDNAYVHIPTDWTTRNNQLILVYTLLWNLQVENKNNYTKGKISL